MGRRKQRRRSGKSKPKLDKPQEKPTPDSSQGTANPGFESDTSVSDNELQSESQDDSKISLLESSTHEEETNNANSQTSASVSQQDLTAEKTASSDTPSIIYTDSDDMIGEIVDQLETCGISDASTEGDYKLSESSSTTISSDQETADASEIQRVYGNFDIIPAPPHPCMYVDVTDFFEARSMNRLINLLCGVDPNDPNLQGAVGGAPANTPAPVPDARGLKLIDIEEVKGPIFVMDKPWCASDPFPTEWYTGNSVTERDNTLKITKRRTPMFQTQKKAMEYNRKLADARRMARNDPNDPPDPITLLHCDQCSFTTRRSTELHDHKAEKHRRRDKRGKR